MDKASKRILLLFGVVLLGIVVTEILRPKPIDWRPSYSATDKIPFGSYILFQELPQLFPGQPLQEVREGPYTFLAHRDSTQRSNYLMINDFLELDRQETGQLLQYVEQGNEVFLAAMDFGTYLSDALKLETSSSYTIKEDSLRMQLAHPTFPKKHYHLDRGAYPTHFTTVDTLNTTVLGHIFFTGQQLDEDPATGAAPRKVNFIRVAHGKGHFLLNTSPQAFTNYYMLQDTHEYVANTLSYLKNRATYWDNYKKTGRAIISSPLRYVLSQPALKWAYYLTISGILLFILFKGKREQRIIPVLEPLRNSSVDFAQTIGNLYHEHQDYPDLIAKMRTYFLEYLRSRYHIDTQNLGEETGKTLAMKSGKPLSEVVSLLDLLAELDKKRHPEEQDLITLNKKIEQFKK